MSLNRVVLIGRLTRDPELRYTTAGIPVAQLGIAVDRITKNDQGEYETDFFNIVAWRRTAEFAQQYLTKGRLIAVEGRLQTRSWVDQTSGQKRTAYEIVADSIQGLDRKTDGPSGPEGAGYEAEPSTPAPASAAPTRPSAPAPRPPAAAGRNAPPDDSADEADPFADE